MKARPRAAEDKVAMVLVRSCLLLSLALFGCSAVHPSASAPVVPARPQPVELAGHGATLAVLARPSAEVADLSGGDRYRVLFEGPSAITLVLNRLSPGRKPPK